MDSFKEQIIKKEFTKNDTVKKFTIMICSVALAFAVIFLALAFPRWAVIGFFLACLCVYGGYYLIQNMSVEYEYIFTNGDLDIDKIIAQRKRKRLVTIKVNDATAVGIADGNFTVGDNKTLVYASSCNPELTDYYINVPHKSLGDTTVIFTPDDDMLRVIKTHLPRTMRNNIQVSDKPASDED